ncbi:MAG: GspE/PulE family protein [Pseudomonadota bacterium]|nr:GspE/PulE family protein [Pseudomonadota bacterium]
MSIHVSRLQAFQDQCALSPADAAHALELVQQTGEPLDQILAQLGLMSEADLAAAFAAEAGVPLADESQLPDVAELAEFREQMNAEFLRQERVLPLRSEADGVVCALVDPRNGDAIKGVEFALRKPIRPVVVTISEFNRLAEDHLSEEVERSEATELDVSADAARLRDLASAAPTVRLVNLLISTAVEARASDIHIEPGQRDAEIRLRIDGAMRTERSISTAQALALVSRIKVLAELDIAERRRPQDGRFSLPVAGRSVDLRISVVPGQFGEGVVIRLLDPAASLQELSQLGYPQHITDIAEQALGRPHGLILVTGPTGSGKTTSLYSFLRRLADGERKILTIEDPIEYRLPGIAQSQTNAAIGVTFASALRSFLRHDPDVVMVGEIRDAETARTAVQAAMTGHLVLSTLHTNDAPSAVLRLIDMGVEDYLLASTLVAVFGQRLVRRHCASCGGAGCEQCNGNGYRGRLALAEAFLVDDDLRRSIRAGGTVQDLRDHLATRDYQTMTDDAAAKLDAGLTSADEIQRALGSLR